MPHNFRITGNIYVSKAGNDSNPGTDPNFPKATIQGAINAASNGHKIVVGSGLYQEPTITSNASPKVINMEGDGLVIIKGDLTGEFDMNMNNGNNVTITWANLTIENYVNIKFHHYFGKFFFTNVVFKSQNTWNWFNGRNEQEMNMTGCQFHNMLMTTASSVGSFLYLQCLIVNSTLYRVVRLLNCDVDETSNIYSGSSIASDFDYNNIRGKVQMWGRSSLETLAAQKAALPLINTNSFSADPLFNGKAIGDYSVQLTSPNLTGANNKVLTVGGVKYARKAYASAASTDPFSLSNPKVSYSGLTGTDDLTLTGTEGWVLSAPIKVNSGIVVIDKINYIGAMTFDASAAGGSINNTNVPDSHNSTSGSAGRNPNRLSYEMRWSTRLDEPTQDSHWDNQGFISAAAFAHFEFGKAPRVDTTGKGNGEDTYNNATSFAVSARYVQIKITLRDNYTSA